MSIWDRGWHWTKKKKQKKKKKKKTYRPEKWPPVTCVTKVNTKGSTYKQQQQFLVLRQAHAVPKKMIHLFHESITGITLFFLCILTKCVPRHPVNT
jgi:hypothetical protein